MSESHKTIFAVITANAADIEQREILSGIIEKAQKLDIDIVVISNIYNPVETSPVLATENKIYDRILSEEIDAFILISESIINEDLKKIILGRLEERKNIPIILIGTAQPEFVLSSFRYINSNDVDDICDITEHLITVHGFTDIDILTGYDIIDASHKRVEGYRKALEKHNIPYDESKVFYGDFWTTSGRERAGKYISGKLPYPQAIICTNDYMAYGLLDEFLENDIEISEKMAVIGYEYIRERYSHSPLLTTYQRNRKELGIAAVGILNGEPYENFTSPKGKLIKGKSCGCEASFSDIKREMRSLQTRQTFEFLNLYSQIDSRLTECRTIDEFVSRCREFQFMVRDVNKMYMCLYENWYDYGKKYDNVVCYNMLAHEKTVIFHKDEFSGFMTGSAAPYYICPLFFADREFGYIVLRYESADCFDYIFRNWLKSISNALEILIMKNDIRYLTACQNLSEHHDIMTAMYNETGIRNAFLTADKEDLYIVMLKICLFDKDFSAINESEKVYAVLDAAEGVKQFCGVHNICGRTDNNTFVCLVKSRNEEDFLVDFLSSVIYQHKSYMDKYGIDSFVCRACKCDNKGFTELFTQCRNSIQHEIEIISERRCSKNYSEMADLRRYIYMNPNETFESDLLNQKFEWSSGHLRAVYKKCFLNSFHHDCISARIAKARFILAVTDMTIQEAAFECGYSDSKYFMRQFLQETGITANQFRKAIEYY